MGDTEGAMRVIIAERDTKMGREIERLRRLVAAHHNVTAIEKIKNGCICPICLEEERRMSKEEKPPLGVMPRWRWLELRASELTEAIHRYINEGSTRGKTRIAQMKRWTKELLDVLDTMEM